MDVKTICRDPRQAITEVGGSPATCEHVAEIEQLAARLAEIKSRTKKSKLHKGELSGQFKDAKNEAERLTQLKAAMKTITHTLSALEQERKETEAQLLAFFEPRTASETDSVPSFPRRFRLSSTAEPAPSSIKIAAISDQDAAGWDTYVTSHEGASLYHLFAWKRVIEQSFGHPCHYYAATDQDGRVRGVLPLVHMESRLFGNYAVSVPFFNYGGAIADSPRIEQALLEHAGSEASRSGWEHIEYRTCREGLGLPCASRKVSMILRLPSSAERLDRDLGAKVRAQYKQARQHQPSVTFGGAELLDDYYRVFSRNMRDLGTPVYAKRFFANILKELPEYTRLVVASIGGKPVGAAFLAGYQEMLEIPWASTLKEYKACNINMWMYHQILGHAIEEGYQFFDFGRSTVDAGTYQFKKQWGAKPLQHHWYYHLNEGQKLPGLNPANPKYQLAIAVWKKLPVFIANVIGPPIVKNLP